MHVVASRRGERTIVDTLRQEGLARCSRPFALPSGGARLVTMQLGPGYVRGDRFGCVGNVGARAELALSPQSATRALGRGEESVATANWHVGAGGTLRLLGEPLVLYPGARHRATTEVELEAGARLVYLDVIAATADAARVTTRLRVRTAGRLLIHDALTMTAERAHGAVGSAFIVTADAGASAHRSSSGAADVAVRDTGRRYDVRIGLGSPACGGLSIRAIGESAFDIRSALSDLLFQIEAEAAGGSSHSRPLQSAMTNAHADAVVSSIE